MLQIQITSYPVSFGKARHCISQSAAINMPYDIMLHLLPKLTNNLSPESGEVSFFVANWSSSFELTCLFLCKDSQSTTTMLSIQLNLHINSHIYVNNLQHNIHQFYDHGLYHQQPLHRVIINFHIILMT